METPRPSRRMLIALCFVLVGAPSCFLFSGSKDGKGGLSKGDTTSYEVASTLRDAGRYDEALRIYFEILDADSTSLTAAHSMNDVADIYLMRGEYGKSMEMLTRLLDGFPAYEKREEIEKKIEFMKTAQRVISERRSVARNEDVIKR